MSLLKSGLSQINGHRSGPALARDRLAVTMRLVSTSSSSKNQQLASRQAKLEEQLERNNGFATGRRKVDERHQARLKRLDLWLSIETIKREGHRLAELDPLQLAPRVESLADISWAAELVEQVRAGNSTVETRGLLDSRQPVMSSKELIDTVLNIYANNGCGLEFGHMTNETEVEWLTSSWERIHESFHLDDLDKQHLAKLMLESEAFDKFLEAKFPTVKRYGCEGAEPMLVVFDELLRLCHLGQEINQDRKSELSAREDFDELTGLDGGPIRDVIIGMPHRGRLNLLACLLGFEPAAILNKVLGRPELDFREAWMAQGDVLSHLSTNTRFVYGLNRHHLGLSRDTPDPINVSLLPNPSHLEVVAPVVAGTARGRAYNLHYQQTSSPKFAPGLAEPSRWSKLEQESGSSHHTSPLDRHFAQILSVQVHGDASLAGQGIIQETLQMSRLPSFSVGGCLHLVVNNQVGFTTGNQMGRSSRHCTDIFKLVEAPIIHVNASSIESVVKATRLALSYRQRFAKDVAINLVCFRKHGHNEMDEPSYTQPRMYSEIRRRPSIPQQFCDQIGMKSDQKAHIVDLFKEKLGDTLKKIDSYKPDNDNYRNFNLASEFHRDHITRWETGCDLELLKSVALASVEVPPDFSLHPNLERVLVGDRRAKFNVASEELPQVKVDWATGEILAFGSLLKQNHPVRMAGQDVARGTFSTRHAVLFDQKTERPYVPLNHMATSHFKPTETQISSTANSSPAKRPALLEMANTILSEEAALAYEWGYSAETCELTIWEAQFGDFFNTAQSVIDTLISTGESKWLKQSAITLNLPHGIDGMGPEHSSGHLERFLQMSSSSVSQVDTEAKINWSVCFPTLPHQYFHLLRRQVLRPFRKPLVVMAPKLIFRLPQCQSELADFGADRSFEPVLDDPSAQSPDQVDTLALCSGKIYFQLAEQKQRDQMRNVAIIRLEELCPFPIQSILSVVQKYTNAGLNRLVWVQEEHRNQGAYSFVAERLAGLTGARLDYIGRPESELAATGSKPTHIREIDQIERQFGLLSCTWK